ncbi:MAG: S1 RNA-binding domain-containing protein [Planctomycetota bacterium]|nr:S1 RNA-binding domain-containing protein [Planctomycetota bacterium]
MNDTTPTPPEEAVDDTAVEVPSAESSGSERKRPALKPTGGDSARAIPSRTKPVTTPSEGEPSIEEKLADVAAAAAAETETADSPPVAQKEAAPAVELPPDDDLDAALDAEIEAALASDDAKLLDLAAQAVASVDGDDSGETGERIEAEEDLEEGTRLKGTIQAIDPDNVFVDIGMRSTGIVPRRQWDKSDPEVGQVIDVAFERYDADEGLIQLNLPRGRRRVGGDWNAVTVGMKCDCVVKKANKGGLEVEVGALRGFLPAGQVDRAYVEDLEPFVGQKLSVQVMEVDSRKRNLVVSRRALLEEEQKDAAAELWQQLNVGDIRNGTVKTLKDYGAFVDLGGLDGFLHIGEISWSRLNHPDQVLTQGQAVEVKILGIDTERSRISLGMKQLSGDPWLEAVDMFAVGKHVSGTVTRIMDFGAFVELAPGIEGLVHISELEHTRVRRVSDVLSEEQSIDVQILEVDVDRQRISLSMKALKDRPIGDAAGDASEEDLPPVERIERSALKGGTGDGGNLFGDPGDF